MPNKPKVNITIGCRNLPTDGSVNFRIVMDVGFEGFSHHKDTLKSDSTSNSNPDFSNSLVVDYVFEEKQIIVATILYSISNQEKIFGQCSVSLARIVHFGGLAEIPIEVQDDRMGGGKSKPLLIIKLREDTQKKESLTLKMNGFELDKKDLFGKSDPYLILFKRSEKGKLTRTYRTEIIKNNLRPDWKPFLVCLNKLCDNDFNNDVIVRCFDWDGADGDPEDMDSEFDEIIGECTFNCQQLLDSPNSFLTCELINHKKLKKKRGYLHSGKLQIHAELSVHNYTFLDYMLSGIDLNFIVAVDLSVPKLNLEDQIESIRLFNVTRQSNEYEVAIKAVLEILQEYDSDNQFPAFGFGAQIPPEFKDCHEYPLNGDFQNPFCRGVEGVLKAYQSALKIVRPLNGAMFSPVIRQVNNLAKTHCDGRHYFTLLLLTNGAAEDWVETKRAVIEASNLPVSIIVVGIGSGTFTDMKTLDQDQGLLKVGTEKALRDNVQFVPMRKFLRMAADGSRSIKWNKVALAKEVLAELPEQLVTYMIQNSIQPDLATASASLPSLNATAASSPLATGNIKTLREVQQQKLRRCVTAHVNIRPPSASMATGGNTATGVAIDTGCGGFSGGGSYRRRGDDRALGQASHANFFSHATAAAPSSPSSSFSGRHGSVRRTSMDGEDEGGGVHERRQMPRRN